MRADGSEFPVELTVVALNLRGRPLFTGYVRDITERKQAEAEREQMLAREQAARAEAEAANQAKDQFLSTLSHELRTPLTPMLGWAEMLLTRKLDEAMTREAHEAIVRSVKTQMRLVEDLLDVSRIITGKLALHPCQLDLESLIAETMSLVRPVAEAKNIVLRTALDMGTGAIVGDPQRLQQVLWNLLANAIKFTPNGGRVELSLERHEGHVRLQVSDSGEGISAAFLPHVFERLRQADNSITRSHGGLGLGLAIVRHLVELHGGSVRVESPGVGQGATFTVELPTGPPAGEPAADNLAAGALAGAANTNDEGDAAAGTDLGRLRDLKILIVDDNSDVRSLVGALLRASGAGVFAAASASEALQSLKQIRPDILVSDIGMPDEDGYVLIRKVRALTSHEGGATPAVALTAYAGVENRARALAAGYQAHLAKPIDPAQLLMTIASLAPPAKSFIESD
jgi:signal transduction histidine kinase/CheY-like chemotaxis protein